MKRALRRLGLLLVICAAGCVHVMHGTPAEQIRGVAGRDAQVELWNGERVLMIAPVIEGDSVIGGWKGEGQWSRRAAVALADIKRVRVVYVQHRPARTTTTEAEEASVYLTGLILVATLLVFLVRP